MLKKVLDLTVSTVFLVLLLPLFILIAVLVRVTSGSPSLFKQERPGLDERPFVLYKFRTMNNLLDNFGNPLPDELRLTKFGMILRKSSLDELPQLFNILKGDLSLVGPRPLLMEYLPRYTKEQARRHHVKPGITGWAQINGRNTLTWEDKFKLDIWYVDHQSFLLDLKIIWLTLIRVFVQKGINQEGRATADKFMGSDGK